MDEAKFVSSNKNKPSLVDGQGFEYKKKRDAGVNKYWVCRKSGCSVKAVTIHPENSNPTIKKVTGLHDHSSEKLEKRVKEMEIEAVCR